MSERDGGAALQVLIGNIEALRSTQFRRAMGAAVGAAAHKELVQGFQRGRDPYGHPWKPLKARRGQPLRDTARLQNSFSAQPSERGFQLVTSVAYAGAHQYGAKFPARSNVKARTVWQNPRSGKFVKRSTKLKQVLEHSYRASYGARELPRRQMVPEVATGGVGPIWGRAMNHEADAVLREQMGQK